MDRLAIWANKALPDPLVKIMARIYHQLLRDQKRSTQNYRILSFPPFEDLIDVDFHLQRISWYLGNIHPTRNVTVYMIHVGLDIEITNRFKNISGQEIWGFQNLEIVFLDRAEIESKKLAKLDLVLEWRSGNRRDLNSMRKRKSWIRRAPIQTVDAWLPEGKEYGVFANLAWGRIFEGKERDEIRGSSHRKLVNLLEEHQSKTRPAFVFGTGPSFAAYQKLSQEGVVIACNSIVEDESFFIKMQPDFFVFADAAHHVGPSKRAQHFRHLLRVRMRDFPKFYVVTTDRFAPIILREFSEFESRFIFLEQSKKRDPNFRLRHDRMVPAMHSVSVIHMFPLAASVSDEILFLGFDGEINAELNDDFWNHSEKLNYNFEIDQFHSTHPSYAYDRVARDTKHEYYEDLSRTFTIGEMLFRKTFVSLSPSQIPAVQERYNPRYFPSFN